MIDVHSHILPGLDDGPPDMEASAAIARLAQDEGVETMVATPHVREDHPYALEEIPARTRALNARLEDEGLALRVVTGGEVAMSRVHDLDDATLGGLCLGSGAYLLVESPYLDATDMLESTLFSLQLRGFTPVLAHPERSPSFIRDASRVAQLVERGVLCSVTAGSMAGRFGRTVQRATRTLFEERLVHNVASDCHDTRGRPPGLRSGFERLDRDVPGLLDQMPWFTYDAPAAMLAGQRLPELPERTGRRRRWGFRRRAAS